MITEDYVSFEVAKLLKEKGFDWYTYAYYEDEDNPNISLHASKAINWNKTEFISKPTLQMAMKWLREACAIEISIACFKLDSYRYDIYAINSSYFRRQIIEFNSDEFCSYEEAVEAALKYCLKNLIN